MSKGLANIMKQAQMIQGKMAKLQEEAKLKTAEATAGGGAVTVTVNGKIRDPVADHPKRGR